MKNPGPAAAVLTDVRYGEIEEAKIENGLTVLVVPDFRFPVVSVQLGLQAGKVHNPDSSSALVQLALEMLREGTGSSESRKLAEELDYWAIQYSADAFTEGSVLSMSVIEPHLEKALSLLSEMLLDPLFPDQELEKVRARWRSYLIGQRSQPEYLAEERLYRSVYRGHPYEKTLVGMPDIEAANRASIRAVYDSLFTPDGALLLFAGPIALDQAESLARKYFGTWRKLPFPHVDLGSVPPLPSPGNLVVDRPGSVQSRVLLALRALPADHPEYVPLKICNQLLGGGASARLFLKLREEKGLTYGIYSRLKAYRTDGLLLVSANVNSKGTGEAIRDILSELARMRRELPAADELARCQSEIVGAFIRQLETPAGVGSLELRRRLNHLPEDYYRKLVPNVRAVTPEKILEIASALFDPESRVLVTVGDRSRLLPQLKPFGQSLVFDVNGNPTDD